MKLIDDFLNSITMYRLVLYYLIALLLTAFLLSFFNVLPFNFIDLLVSVSILTILCWSTNTIFAKTFKAQTNVESVYISAFILALIITPIKNVQDISFLFWVSVWAMASKYIFALNKKHLFNPVAISVVLISLTLNNSASWWVGSSYLLPVVSIGGLLIVRKIRRFDLSLTFLLTALITILGFGLLNGSNPLTVLQKAILDTPILFFTFVMMTEPLTTPPTKWLRVYYAIIVGFLFAPRVHLGSFYTTPEIALVVGNIFSYIVSQTKLRTIH
jgi:Na+-transporting NADH:ubiquinone oxidoreductase subunit NqrB